jgi:membrane protein DedA with SNARE-associated domain
MSLGRFVLLNTLGSSVCDALLIGTGWTLGEIWERATRFVGSRSKVLLVVMLLAAIGLGLWWWRERAR